MIQPAPPPPAVHAAATAPPSPPSSTVIVTCAIGPGEVTRDCATDPDPGHPGAADAVIASLAAHPLRLPGARIEQRVTVGLVRANLGKPHPFGPAPVAPYKPDSITIDSAVEPARYYPDRAARMMVQGQALARCKVTDEGRLDECWVRGEEPAGYGFGVAALLLATQAMRAPPPGPGEPAYDWRSFDVPMNWSLPATTPRPASSP
ncbi:hypothetical protein [Phenylobacterium sp.]|uniref:hypothetical protein n=1 Tax=Phenylobacterium sp. TaxID=1871053 RepID=UPI00261C80D2|nr:hypothetical protein [Phenylobacterium sp.]